MLWGVLDYLHHEVRQWIPSPWALGTREHEASIILTALEALLRAAEGGFGLLSVVFAGVREQDPEDGKLEGLRLLTRLEKGCSGGGGWALSKS